MTTPKPLSKRQLAVLDELFASDKNEKDILEKYKVGLKRFNKWLREPAFIEQFDKHTAAAHRRSVLHIARFASNAATRLVVLSEKGEGETARKACLDIVSGCDLSPTADQGRGTKDDGREPSEQLSPEIASRLLAALAEETQDAEHAIRLGPAGTGVPSASEGPRSATG